MDGVTDELSRVPVVDVHRDNLTQIWPSLMLSLNTADFIAVDIELSGLGNRKSLMAKSVEDRYAEISKSAKTRSILSLGVSCFRSATAATVVIDTDDADAVKPCYVVQTFDLVLLCAQDYVVETASLQFLVDHGFDFNKQYSKGIPYLPGNPKESMKDDDAATKPSVRLLFACLVSSAKALVVHNGLVDLAFLYQHFYAELPSKLATFVADLCEMFTGGLFDTKYLAEFHLRHSASYLEYVFRKLQLSNESAHRSGQPSVRVTFPKYGAELDCVDYRDLSTSKITGLNKEDVCLQFANHGFCLKGIKCELSHNVSAVLQMQLLYDEMSETHKRRRQRGRKRKKASELTKINDNQKQQPALDECDPAPVMDSNSIADDSHPVSPVNPTSGSTHRAGYDAFMTGFAMAVFLASDHVSRSPSITLADESFVKRAANRICLSGKDQPLLIQRSSFAPTSKQHQMRIIAMKKNAKL